MNIEIENVTKLVEEADKILLEPEAEKVIIQLLKIQKQAEEAIKLVKEKIEVKAKELNINFKSIVSDNLKVSYRQYGAKYRIDEAFLNEIPKELYKTKFSYDVIAEEVEKWTEVHKGMPIGINEVERPKSLSFSLKGEKENE